MVTKSKATSSTRNTRHHQVSTYVTDTELDFLNYQADILGCSRAEVLRQLVLMEIQRFRRR